MVNKGQLAGLGLGPSDPSQSLPVGPGYLEARGAASAANVDAVNMDVRGYATINIYVPQTSGYVGTLTPQWSGDGGATWSGGYLDMYRSSTGALNRTATIDWNNTGGGITMYSGPVRAGRFRLRSTAWTSGTITVWVLANTVPPLDQRSNQIGVPSGSGGSSLPPVLAMANVGGTFYPLKASSSDGTLAVQTQPRGVSSATMSSVAAATGATNLLLSNSVRLGFAVYNDSTAAMYLLAGTGTVSTTVFTAKLAAGGYFDMVAPIVYTGIVAAVWDAATGSARLTEWA